MKSPNQHKRIDLAEIKAEIFKKLGPERSKKYFLYLSKFLNLKLSKVEFNKLCFRIFGKQNLPLHNQFIHSIVKNAYNSKAPPPKAAFKSVNKRNEPNKSLFSNGDTQKVPLERCNSKLLSLENGDLSRNQVPHHQVLADKLENEVIFSEDDRHDSDGNLEKSAFCGASSFSISSLLDSSTLRERMEKIALLQGLKGVTLDCANLLNKGLDSYLKGLISKSYTNKHQSTLKLINGVSLLDFKVAMELDPQQLGEDWPLIMEKIYTQSFCEE